jgi:hypothetical protein
MVNVPVQPCHWSLALIFGSSVIGQLLYSTVHCGAGCTENINKGSPVAPASYYFYQNEILHSERVSYLAGMSPYISLKIKKRHYEHHMIEAHK